MSTAAQQLRQAQAQAKREALELEMAQQLRAAGIEYVREYKFHPDRQWRLDFRIDAKLAIEVEGGIWSGGRHTRGAGFTADAEKYAEALVAGWRVLRVTGDQVRSGQALQWVERLLKRA